ncbi:MAG: hypothetical protein ABI741_06220 [Ferruginibacter sp.]
MKKSSHLFLLTVLLVSTSSLFAQYPITLVQPENCLNNKGSITIGGFTAAHIYSVVYNKDSSAQPAITLTANAANQIVITGLTEGLYSNMSVTGVVPAAAAININGSIVLEDKCIARQKFKFIGAAYANFTGVQADDPTGFAQFYARLSVPVFKIDGIPDNATKKRFIPLRNIYFQLMYGNTDKFKLYSFDSMQNRFLNRVDLLAHNYFSGSLGINALTIIVPRRWSPNTGDLIHLYLDGISALTITKVYDTLQKSDPATNKDYNVKTALYGFSAKAAFQEGRWRMELAFRRFWLYPMTNMFNNQLNSQRENINEIYLPDNSDKKFLASRKKSSGYCNLEALFVYNTGSKPTKDDSNIFLRYSYTSNMPSASSERFANTYFQFQLGYSQDITKIFSKKGAD